MAHLFCALKIAAIAVYAQLSAATSDPVFLSRVSPLDEGDVCPGQDVIYNCTLHGDFNLAWTVTVPGEPPFGKGTKNVPQNFTLGPFWIQIIHRTFGSSESILSTATLQQAQFSHNGIVIECGTAPAIVEYLYANNTLSVLGASSQPYNITLIPQNASSVFLSWLPPNGSNCSFSYAVSSNGSFVTRYRTSKPSLEITDLNITTYYQFAVAAEDSNLTTGPWSETAGILWNVPQVILNVTSILKHDVLEGKWILIHQTDYVSPPTLHYKITHNITSSEDTVNLTVNHTSINISLEGVPPGHYYIAVAAVNIIGEGNKYIHLVTVMMPEVAVASKQHFINLISSEGSYVSYYNIKDLLSSSFSTTSSSIFTGSFMSTTHVGVNYCSTLCTPSPPTVYTSKVAVAAVVSGVLSAVGTAVVTSIITWCVVVRCRQQAKPTATSSPDGEKAFSSTELIPVEYEVPVLKDQSITVGDNVAYGNKITLQQNVAYEQVYTH